MTQDWDIQPRSESCGTCRQAFTDRQPYFSRLVFGTQGYARQDFCAPCWTARATETPSRYSAWQGIFRSPPPPAEEPLKKETAESLLRKLIEDQDPARQDAMFILAVMLERKRIFVERDVQVQEGQTTRVYEHRQTGETFVIRDPHLDLNALSHVQQEVSELLGASKPAPAAGSAPAAVASAPGDARDNAADPIPEMDELDLEEADAKPEPDDEATDAGADGEGVDEDEFDEENDEDEFEDDDEDDEFDDEDDEEEEEENDR